MFWRIPQISHTSAAMMVALVTMAPGALADTTFARDMFYQQLDQPSQKTNTGLSYWIELRRGGQFKRVDSRYRFLTGDRIRFHLTPNIDGYTYVVLLKGTSGAQSILFPVPGKDPTNRVTHGKECTIPASSYLVFDRSKGTEHVRIALSRHNIDKAELSKPDLTTTAAIAAIASSQGSDSPSLPAELKIAFPETTASSNVTPDAPQTTTAGATASSTADAGANAIPDAIPNDDGNSKDLFRDDPQPSQAVAKPKAIAQAQPHHQSYASHLHTGAPERRQYHTAHQGAAHTGISVRSLPSTVIVNTEPDEVLYADISLEHG